MTRVMGAAMAARRQWLLDANPLAQSSIGFFSLVASYSVDSVSVALVALGCYAVAVIAVAPSWRYPLVCLGFSSIAALTITYSTWRLGGHDLPEAATAGLRMLVLAWPGAVGLGYIDPARLADYLAQTVRLPARMVAAFSAALQRIASFGHAWSQLERVRRVRGYGPSANPATWFTHGASMAFALLVHALRGASQTAIAMDARGFATAHERTWAEPATWTRLDRAVVATGLLLGSVAPIATLLTR
jgi:energy-coupling factor transport system permease protein